MIVSKSFVEAMEILTKGGKVRRKGWGTKRVVEMKECLIYDEYVRIPVLITPAEYTDNVKIPELIPRLEVVEVVPWSPALSDLSADDWETVSDPLYQSREMTFGEALNLLIKGDVNSIYHPKWSKNVRLVLEPEIMDLKLMLPNGERVSYLVTTPDIARVGWQIERSLTKI